MILFCKKLFDNYLNLYFHLSICLVGFLWFQQKSLKFEISWNYGLFLFFATLLVYNLHALSLDEFKPRFNRRWIVIFIGIIGSVLCLHSLSYKLIFLILPAAIVTLTYVLPVLPQKRKLRDLNWIKIFLLSGTIAYVTTFVPFSEAGVDSFVKLITFLSRALFIFILGLLFDLKDRTKDEAHSLKSFPVVLGFKKTKIISFVLLITMVLIDFYATNQFIFELNIFLSLLITYGFLVFLIVKAKDSSSSYFFPFWVDGVLVLPYLILGIVF